MTTKTKPRKTPITITGAVISPAELDYHRSRIDQVAARAKTAVRIEANGRRRVVRRRKR